MSSPHSAGQRRAPETIRNPRRRRRNDSETLRQAPRKRSKISESTFEVRDGGHSIGDDGTHEHINGNASILTHMPVRGKRQASISHRSTKADGSEELSRTAEYIVKKLPALPERLRNDATGSFRAFFQSSQTSHHVVATTREAALLWDYNSSIAAPVPRVLNHQQVLKYNEPLPIAHLSITGTSSDVGLVMVYPNTGKISFRENLDSVDSLSLFQRHRQGVEGSFKLMNGETVVDVVNVKDAGYVLVLSSGRLAHLTVRDQQGRPAIAVSQMNSEGPTKGSWLGSFSSILGGGWRNTLAAVKAHSSTRSGQMEVIATTVEGTFKFWDVSHDGQTMFKYQIDTFEDIRQALVEEELLEAVGKAHVQVMDFAIVQTSPGTVGNRANDQAGIKAVVLVAYDERLTTRYALLHFTLHGSASLTRATPITVYHPPTSEASKEIRLLVPQNGHTAFLVSSNTVVVVSSLDVRNPGQPPFQDIICFRSDKGTQIVSSSIEIPRTSSKLEESNILLFTQSYGAVRISADKGSLDAERPKVSAKSKIEQAIFFGTKPNNILNLTDISDFAFSTEEAEDAAARISHEILRSTSVFVPDVMSSLDSQINMRIKALHDLIVFMRDNFSPLSRTVKWSLLLDAERMASALSLWHTHEKWLAKKKNKEDTMLHQCIEAINERLTKPLIKEKGEVDPVREWLTHDMHLIEKMLAHIHAVDRERREESSDVLDLVENTLEAYEVFDAALQTAFDFRMRNSRIYGLEDESMENGILCANYEGLPDIWTARSNTVSSVYSCVQGFGKRIITLRALLSTQNSFDRNHIAALSKAHPKLVYLSCLVHTERACWLTAHDHASGERFMHQFSNETRPQQLLCIAEIGQAFAGMDIAEKLHDVKSLVDLILHELELVPDDREYQLMKGPGQIRADKYAKELKDKTEGYFQKLGSDFAEIFFSAHVEDGQLADLLEKDFGKSRELTKFLRSDPERFKMCWLNDVIAEKDLLHAGKALMAVAQNKEMNIWSKHAELSIAKLSLLASKSGEVELKATGSLDTESDPDDLADVLLKLNQTERQTAKIQEDLYNHLRPTFALGINDEEGRVAAAMEVFGRVAVNSRPCLQQLLQQDFSRLQNHEVIKVPYLINILTLMDSVTSATQKEPDPAVDIRKREFSMALHVLDSSQWCNSLVDEEIQRGEMLKKLIWKRLFIRDDWETINDTKGKSDEASREEIQATLLYATLRDGLREFAWIDAKFSATNPAWTVPCPTDVLSAGSHPDDWDFLFPGQGGKDLRVGIAHDNAQDDEILTEYLERFRVGFHFDAAKKIAFDDVSEEHELQRVELQAVADFGKSYKIPEMEHRQMVELPEGVEFLAQSAASSPRRPRTFSRVAGYEQEVIDLNEDEDEDEGMESQESDYESREGAYDDEPEEQYDEEQFEAQSGDEETVEDETEEIETEEDE
ncbi:hypothetical protein FKW77_001968 [Venturia effusa]|uniref:Nucleoporin Nup133/Nup155-like C-terminal domain-containing protein n=1 Tax=Venturia effusa TaxID=50376 RepID=A0A517LKX7_9PEZI|nr:hypothetical protein FKW77_001968 [Venturia effusa]